MSMRFLPRRWRPGQRARCSGIASASSQFFRASIHAGCHQRDAVERRMGTAMPAWRDLSVEDLSAIAQVVRGFSTAQPEPVLPKDVLDLGAQVYSAHCAQCHGERAQETDRRPNRSPSHPRISRRSARASPPVFGRSGTEWRERQWLPGPASCRRSSFPPHPNSARVLGPDTVAVKLWTCTSPSV